MANIMSNFKLKNNPSRSGFDLTKRTTFSAKIGELLPCYCKEVLPGDKFKIKLNSFTRLQPLAAPAFVRLREYYDFVYVPTRLLWRYADALFDQMPNYLSSNSNISDVLTVNKAPYFTRLTCNDAIESLADFSDDAGMDCDYGATKLLDMLGYGQVWFTGNDDLMNNHYKNTAFNIFPILAYQKAYCDIFRFDQWEQPSPHTYNIDYADPGEAIDLTGLPGLNNFFTLRYANYPKDLLMGLLPNTQYGDVAVVGTINNIARETNRVLGINSDGKIGVIGSSQVSQVSPAVSVINNDAIFNFSVLALRQAELLQKYKEISLTSKQDHAAQLKAHWNVNLSKGRSLMSEYLGGISQNVQIDSVVNQNLASSQDSSDLRGIGMSGTNGTIDFNVPEHGYILCIYHCAPIIDYDGANMIFPQNLHLDSTDFAIPELDRAGMQSAPSEWYFGSQDQINYDSLGLDASMYTSVPSVLGYAPRYIEYKTDVDTCHGLFSESYNTELSAWVSPFKLKSLFYGPVHTRLSSPSFKVKASQFDNLFKVKASSKVDSDQLLICADFDVKAVRNLDYDGMPY